MQTENLIIWISVAVAVWMLPIVACIIDCRILREAVGKFECWRARKGDKTKKN